MIIICRLALFNKQGEHLIEEKFGMKKFLLRLEVECGGEGNGLLLVKDKKVIYFNKGLKYSSNNITKKLNKTDYDYAIFHTRIKSVGAVSNSNCHPFKAGNTYLAMNGTEIGYSGLADALKITDTEAILKCYKKFDFPLLDTLKRMSSNFLGFHNGTVFATSPNYIKSYAIAKDDNGAIVIASSLPKEFKIYEPKERPFVWTSNKELSVQEKTTVITTYDYTKSYHYNQEGWRGVHNRGVADHVWCRGCDEIIRVDEMIDERYCPECGTEANIKKDAFSYSYALD